MYYDLTITLEPRLPAEWRQDPFGGAISGELHQ